MRAALHGRQSAQRQADRHGDQHGAQHQLDGGTDGERQFLAHHLVGDDRAAEIAAQHAADDSRRTGWGSAGRARARWRMAAMVSALASGPAMIIAGSAGTTCSRQKQRNSTPSSAGNETSRRWTICLPMRRPRTEFQATETRASISQRVWSYPPSRRFAGFEAVRARTFIQQHSDMHAVCRHAHPPACGRTWPVMKPAPSEQRKQIGGAELVGLAEPAQRDLRRHLGHRFLVGEQRRREVVGVLDIVRADGVHRDAVAPQLLGERGDEAVGGGARRDVRRVVGDAAQRRGRGHEHDAARLALAHRRRHELRRAGTAPPPWLRARRGSPPAALRRAARAARDRRRC